MLPKTAYASDLLKTAPLTYRDQATNATLNGYHAAFVATIFGVLGLAITFFLNKRSDAC